MTALLEVSDVRKTYGDRVVLADVDLTVEPHDVVCLIGSSGSGKSTLLRCLNLLEDVDDGVIVFDGREISDPRVDRREVRSRMGLVFQAYNLFPHLTVLDNCTLAPRRVHGLARGVAEERARELLGAVRAGRPGRQAPRPAVRRAAAAGGAGARAVHRAELLLLDEITAALDPELVGEVLAIVRDLAAAGTTMVVATHEMAFARDVATRCASWMRVVSSSTAHRSRSSREPREERTRQFLRRVLPH